MTDSHIKESTGYEPWSTTAPAFTPSQPSKTPSQLVQPGYAPFQQGYVAPLPSQGYVPYSYGEYHPPPTQYAPPQQQQTNITVVQPSPVVVTTRVSRPTKDNYFTASIVLTIICMVVGGWPSLLCTITAMALALWAKDDQAKGMPAAADRKAKIAKRLNIAAVIFHVVISIGLIIVLVVPYVVIQEKLKAAAAAYKHV